MPTQFFNYSAFLFFYYAHAGTFSSYASLFYADKGMSVAQIGVLMALIQVMRIFGPNLWGWVADHSEHRVRVLRMTGLAALAAFSGFFIGTEFAHFFAAMVVLNLFTSAQGPLCEALMLSEMRGDMTYYGRIRLWGSIGFIIMMMATAYVLDWFGTGALPWSAGALLLCTWLAALRLRDVRCLPHQGPAPALLAVLRKREVIAFFASSALAIAAHMALYTFYSLYLARHGYSKALIGAMWSLGVVAEVVLFYFQGPLLKKWGVRHLLMLTFVAGAVRFAMIGAGAQWIAVLVAAQVLHAATFALHHSASVLAMQPWFAGPLQARGQALYISLSYGVGGSLAAVALSRCWELFGAESVYFVAAVLCVLAGMVSALSFHWQRTDHPA
jgi:PPP family 3-phenylpropionic acid transporter